MERTLIHELLVWIEKETRKPLILKGVRQCGKTYLLKDFGKKQCHDGAKTSQNTTKNSSA